MATNLEYALMAGALYRHIHTTKIDLCIPISKGSKEAL